MENVPAASQTSSSNQTNPNHVQPVAPATPSADLPQENAAAVIGEELSTKLDEFSLEAIVEHKIARFLDQIGMYYPENLHSLIMKKVEKPLLAQILKRTGGNQVHASKILGINRNTLRKKMKMYGLYQ